MKIGLIGVNSQFVHSNLALYYLRENLPDHCSGEIKEYNNNEPILDIFYDIISGRFDVIAFSVYIWNKETVIKLAKLIKEAAPKAFLILGGPEPTYAPADYPYGDVIVYGALETTWAPLLTAIANGDDLSQVKGIHGDIQFAADWEFPYREDDLPQLKNKLVYYETSRGCPYHCAFCLSSAESHTAYLPLARVKKELDFFLGHDIPVVKLVDRTFNAPKERGKEILRYLLAHYKAGVTFHFELKGELLDEETVELLTSAPKDFFQVEIGVQTLNEAALAESCRSNQWPRIKAFYKQLTEAENLHTHFDLIAGLPNENLPSFAAGFNEVMSISPDYLQLGFLKLLPGTKLAATQARYGFVAEDFPPYEVVQTAAISTEELRQLKKLDHFMDTIYNKGTFRQTLRYAVHRNGNNCFTLFSALAKSDHICATLQQLLWQKPGVWQALSRFDTFLNGTGGEVTLSEERAVNRFVQDKVAVAEVLPHYKNTPSREIYKRVRILEFPVVFRFDDHGNVTDVGPGESRVLLDYRVKGKQKRNKNKPDVYVL